jgi:hypothetical protein
MIDLTLGYGADTVAFMTMGAGTQRCREEYTSQDHRHTDDPILWTGMDNE